MQTRPSIVAVAFAICLYCGVTCVSAQTDSLSSTIDDHVRQAWQREKVQPALPSDDAAFLRRIFLDLVGTIPTYEETKQFLGDNSPDKRSKLIDRLLDDPRFADHQTDVWDMILFGRNPPGYGTDKRQGFQDWLREQFAKNVPYNEWAGQILRAEGNTVEQGAPMFYVQYKSRPEDATEKITQTFLGIQLQCSRCHDHPFEKWTQLDFYGMAAFLARLNVVEVGKKNKLAMYAIGEKNKGDVLFTGPVTEQAPGKKGEPVKPKFLHGDVLQEPELPKDFEEPRNFPSGKVPPKPQFSRKDQLANWVTSVENPYFARAVANRIWAQFMGRGIVHPVDNMSASNKPSHPALLDALTKLLVEHEFDLKWYIRQLCNTQTYQLSSTGPVESALPRWFERARSRTLTAEELVASWRVAVGYDASQQSSTKKSGDRYRPIGSGYLLRFFGKPNNGVGDFQGGLHEHLYMNNGGLGKLMVTQKGSLHDTLMTSTEPWENRVDRLFLSMLSRPPTDEERSKFVEYVTAEEKPHDRLREAIWTLMTCSEFRFNH